MDVARITSVLVLTVILVVAVVQDLRSLRVSNRLILVGICAGIPLRIWVNGVGEVVWILPGIILPVVILYLFYLSGILGAADIKLFSVIGSFLNLRELKYCIVVAFCVGAVLAVFKMLRRRNLWLRMSIGFGYIADILHGQIRTYEADDDEVLHFSVSILIGMIIVQVYLHAM